MAAKFTLDQRQAIDQRACNILVSAAAGSGKTTVLVERIVEIVCDKERGVDIDRLLVVTFTKAAAAQMRERLIEALTKRLEAEINNSYLQRQLLLVHNAQITTIDSFCLYLIRNHFNDIGLDPDFRTVEEGELRLLSREVLSKLLEEKFEEADPAFLRCVESFSNIGEKKLEELVLQLYEFAMSHPWPKEWLLSHSRDYQIGETVLEEAAWYRHLWEITVLLLQECKRLSEESAQICASRGGLKRRGLYRT